ncbi:MAG: DEAD/DEAH box helicase [Candidatus Thermoplasmatota archaeon]|nr:DEAD/DEAH box helicase [Candidatus Thermoplasmatota archaeon]
MEENIFETLHPDIRSMLFDSGISHPTEAQRVAIGRILEGENLLLLSPTGSGKTEAAILPIFHKILTETPQQISTLFITPLRALNRDMLERLLSYGNRLGIRIQVRHSDITQAMRREITTRPADVLITTPESLQLMLSGKNLRKVISSVKYVIVDELHETAQNERGTQFAVALERLRQLCGNFQRIGLSATVGNPEDLALFLDPSGKTSIVKADLKKNMDIRILIPDDAPEDIAEKMGTDAHYGGAIVYIWNMISQHRGTLVFTNTRSVAEDMAFRLRLWLKDPPVQVHHGSLSREARESAEQDFKAGKIKALICTSSLELGIDIGSADLVLQFNSPRQINKLIQRIGRSSHYVEKTSKGVIICSDIIEMEEACAIVSHVQDGHLEDIQIRKNSMATLVNQLLGELRIHGSIDTEEFYSVVTRSYPFRNLDHDEYTRTLEFLASINKIYLEGNRAGRRRGVLNYFIENISMIPSEKNFKVIDTVNRKFVGTLDERYVVNEIEPGSYFVIRGSTWRTIRIDGEKILVEPFPTAAIAPKWSGEEIPVLPDVAQKVSELRQSEIVPEFVDSKSISLLRDWYAQNNARYDNCIIETRMNEIVIQPVLGTRANFALAEIFSGILSGVTGESVEMDFSPYHIYARAGRRISADEVRRILLSIEPENLMSHIVGIARRSRFFNGVFLYEARKFGVISNESDISRMRFEKIVDSYLDTPLFRDSIRKMISDYMDLDTLGSFLRGIRDGTVSLSLSDTISESSNIFISHYSERVAPLKPTKTILDAVKKRLLNEEVTLYCTSCRNVRTQKIRDITNIKCFNCGSSLVATLSPFEKDILSEADPETPEGRKVLRRLSKNAHLVRERGMQAVMVMAARGIGPETASRMLQVSYLSEDDFIKAILTGEMDYAKNRRFWD